MEKNNTKEEFVLSYLLFLQKYDKEEFKKAIRIEQICISENNYKKYFNNIIKDRKNAREKFLYFFDFIKNVKLEDLIYRKKFMSDLIILANNEINIQSNKKNEITWENEELYLNNLYFVLLGNLTTTMNNFYESYIKDQKTEEFYDSEFFEKYALGLSNFVESVEKNFKIKFKNLELKDMEDKVIFEDYINFIGTYIFSDNEGELIQIWKEIFVPLSQKEKKTIFESYSQKNCNINKIFIFNDKMNQIEIIDKKINKIIIINEIENYAFLPLCDKIINSNNETQIEWFKNQFIKPSLYNDKLFVSTKKDIWKDLLFKILNSRSYIEIKNSLFEKKQINYFEDKKIISKIIDNIRYFSYKTDYHGATVKNTFRIYEDRNFNKEIMNKSIALLIFYGFHIIINIHEIGGHINIKLQFFFTSNIDFNSSPKINEDKKTKYLPYGKSRDKELGETIEIGLFGKVVETLTIKEALYILDENNYKKSSENFRKDFLEYNNKDINEILENKQLKELLMKLDIKIIDIILGGNRSYRRHNLEKGKNLDKYYRKEFIHPLNFYYDNISTLLENLSSFIENNSNK